MQSYKGNDDWLITPAVTLGGSSNLISMYLKSLSSSYGDERFQIGVYVGSGNPTKSEDFVIISTQPHQTVPQNLNIDNNWRNFTYNLDAFAGQTVRIGIHCITQEASALLVDDVIIATASTLAGADIPKSPAIGVYPNPVEDELYINTNKKIAEANLYSLDGRLVQTIKNFPIGIKHIPKGNYLIHVLFEDGTRIFKKIQKK